MGALSSLARAVLLPIACAMGSLFVTACPLSDEGLALLSVELSVSPMRLTHDPLYGGAPVLSSLVVENRGGAPVRLLSTSIVDASGPDVDVTLSPVGDVVPARGSLEIRVTVQAPESTTGLFTADFVLSFEGELDLVVPLVASLRPVPSCDDDNPCTEDTFVDGSCRNVLAVNGTPCDDENACTTATLCLGGACVGQPVICNDDTPCTLDACDPATGCVFEPRHTECDDDDPCTDDVCSSETGCENPAKEPGALCHFGGCEEVGLCINGLCQMHEVPNGFPCSDGDACTVGDSCQEGLCAPGPAAESGPEEPRVLVDTAHATSLCDETMPVCNTFWLEPARVLAAHQRLDGEVQVVWRTRYTDSQTGAECDPFTDLWSQLELHAIPPVEENDGESDRSDCECESDDDCSTGTCMFINRGSCRVCVDADAEDPVPSPPLLPSCSAGVFLTRADDDGVLTVQLTESRGAVAAALVDTASTSAQVIIARAHEAEDVFVRLYTGQGTSLDQRVLARPANGPTAWPIGELAVDADATRLTVVALPITRDAAILSAGGCTDDGLCNGVPSETWNVSLFSSDDSAAEVPTTRTLAEWPDPRCVTGVFGFSRPLLAHDLQVALDSDDPTVSHVALRMDPFECGDIPGNTVLSSPLLYRFIGTPVVGVGPDHHHAPLLFFGVPGIHSLEHIDGLAAATPNGPAGVVSYDVCDTDGPETGFDTSPEEDCVCLDCDGCVCDCNDDPGFGYLDMCTRSAVVRLQTGGSVVITDHLFTNLAPGVAEAHSVFINGDVLTVARTGNVLSLLGRTDAGELLYKPAPALPSHGRWRDRLVAGSSLVAGLVDVWSGGDTLLPAAEEFDPIETAWVVSQGFACGAEADTPPPFACTSAVDCPGGLVCDQSACACTGIDNCDAECVGVCLAPEPIHIPSSDAGVDDAGVDVLCLEDEDCGSNETCIIGESCIYDALCTPEDPVPCGTGCYGTCVPYANPSDAGTLDASESGDAGEDDAGETDDAGLVPEDGGAFIDAGALGGGGLSVDADAGDAG